MPRAVYEAIGQGLKGDSLAVLGQGFKNFLQNFNLMRKNEDKHKLNRLPYWYIRICAKQIILRDLKFYKILNSLVHLKEIFQLIKGSNILVKFSVILETLINILWVATIRLFSEKGVGKNRYAGKY